MLGVTGLGGLGVPPASLLTLIYGRSWKLVLSEAQEHPQLRWLLTGSAAVCDLIDVVEVHLPPPGKLVRYKLLLGHDPCPHSENIEADAGVVVDALRDPMSFAPIEEPGLAGGVPELDALSAEVGIEERQIPFVTCVVLGAPPQVSACILR